MNARKVFAAALVALALGLPALHARQARDQMQAPKTGTAAISGVILTDENTPQPIKRATVMVINAESAFTKMAYTNDTGRFRLGRNRCLPASTTLEPSTRTLSRL